ncbi:kinesin-like protein KIF18A [Babylonia areolata]|uniref:kinesin-like protein KIF18A n=1 Tax=Babylonia areolata TaxID=304850 RepID=UPI003FD4E9F9
MTVLNSCASDTTMAGAEENGSNNVKVIVRVRPPNDLERNGQRKNVVEIMNENILVFDPKEETSPFRGRHGKRRHRDIRKRRQKDLKFAFDHVFDWTSNNMEVFDSSTRTLLDGLLGGYNCSVFAYGATGAGKTFTMLGNETNPGVIYHTMIHLYRHIAEMSSEKTCDVAVSYLEVYNEQIRDLLMPHGTLPIREDHNAGVIVPGLSLHKPSSAEELLHMLHFGNKNRTQHPTDANAESSRSHAVFQVFVRQRERTANISAQVKVAKMCLVDLAGSERATLTKNQGARFREGANINRSLLALGNVINSLADHKYKGHIPYRDSKLTRLLKDSLGGNCRTIMIAAVSPSDLSYEETYNTLKYADRAKSIRLNMKKNVVSVDFHISQYPKIVNELRREIAELKTKLQHCEGPAASRALSLSLPANLHSLHQSLQAAYSERRAVRERQLRQEMGMRDTQWRLYRKHKCLRRAQHLAHPQPQSIERLQGVIEGLQRKVQDMEAERQALCHQLNTNTHTLHTLHTQAAVTDKASLPSQFLETSVQKMSLEVEVNDARHYIHHLRRLARAQEQEAVASETLLTALLQLVQHQQSELRGHGLLTPDLSAEYMRVCQLVGQWGVSWADGEGDTPPFHINSIINIPLVTTSGVAFNRVPSPGHPPARLSAHAGPVMSTSLPASLPSPAPSVPCSQQRLLGHLPPPTAGPSPAPGGTQGAVLMDISNRLPDNQDRGCGYSPSSTVYAGHTPNPKKLIHGANTHSTGHHPQPTPVAEGSDAHPHTGHCLTAVSRPPPPSQSLNETFSLDGSVVGVDSSVESSVGCTVVLKGPSHLCLPVVDNQQSCGHQHSAGGLHADTSLVRCEGRGEPHHVMRSAPGSVLGSSGSEGVGVESGGSQRCQTSGAGYEDRTDRTGAPPPRTLCALNQENETIERPQQKSQSSASTLSALNQENERPQQKPESSASTFSALNQENRRHQQKPQSTASILSALNQENERPQQKPQSTASTLSALNQENERPQQKAQSTARRSINFGGVQCESTPVRVEGKSYADAVRTPTPPRQPLSTLNCNSPQLHTTSMPGGDQQTPRSAGRSVYLPGPQALDNMRRLKQLGMPSLVESLVTGHRSSGQSGVSETNRPGYMQPTQATARRVRRQPLSKDDCFNPRRVAGRTLAHSRSKSTSQLNRVGWKV